MTQRLIAGRIVGAHGIRGECVVVVEEEFDSGGGPFEKGCVVWLDDSTGHSKEPSAEPAQLTVRLARPHKGRLLVQFAEVLDRNHAEDLRGSQLWIESDQVPALPEGRYRVRDLIGAKVEGVNGEPLGLLQDVLESPAHDIWVVRTPEGADVMVPAVKEFIREVDPGAARIVLAPIEGMFE